MSPFTTRTAWSRSTFWRLLLASAIVAVTDFYLINLARQYVVGIEESMVDPTRQCWLTTGGDGWSCFNWQYSYNKPGYYLLVLGLLLAVMLSWILGRFFVLTPLRAMTDSIRQLGPQNLGQRVRMTSSRRDPLKRLADELDAVLDRIAAGYESQRGFATNAAHELRTPLAVQRALIEVAMDDHDEHDLRQFGRHLLAANERNERLVEGLLVLAEVDRGLVERVPVRLDQIVSEALNTHAELAKAHKVTLRGELAEQVVPGEAVLLERLAINLIRNAILHNKEGGWVEVVVGHTPALLVRNNGHHVPAETVPTLFEPFRRGVRDRAGQNAGGAGLGLSIARSIVNAHGGTVEAASRQDGGLAVSVLLPD